LEWMNPLYVIGQAKNGIKEDQRKNNGKTPVYHELETQLIEELLKTRK